MSVEQTQLSDPVPLFSPEMREDPFPLYDKLRATDPVYWSEKHQAWILTSFDAVVVGLNDLRLSSDRAQLFEQMAGAPELKPLFSFLSKRMILADPPTHTRLRGLVSKSFTPHVVEAMRPHIQQLVDGLLDGIQSKGKMDFVADFAFPLPATVIAETLGLPPEDRDKIKKWSDEFVAFFSTHPANVTVEQYRRSLVSMNEMVDYFRSRLPGIRAGTRACVMKLMEEAEHQEGDKLTEEELFANANLMLIAGHETTTGVLTNGLLSLLKSPDQMRKLLDDPGLLPNAIEEFLRHDGPVQFTNRVAREDVTIGGKTIRKGQLVFLFIAAANRDPAHFPNPSQLDITRKDHKHVSMGQGHHFCLGAPLARLETQIAFSTVLRRLPNMRLESGKVVYRENFNLHCPVSLPIAFG